MNKDRILTHQVTQAFKEQELAKFKSNLKRAFRKRVDLYMKNADMGERAMT